MNLSQEKKFTLFYKIMQAVMGPKIEDLENRMNSEILLMLERHISNLTAEFNRIPQMISHYIRYETYTADGIPYYYINNTNLNSYSSFDPKNSVSGFGRSRSIENKNATRPKIDWPYLNGSRLTINLSQAECQIIDKFQSQVKEFDGKYREAHDFFYNILDTSSTLKQATEQWPAIQSLVPQDWIREEEYRKEEARKAAEERKRRKIIQEQALKVQQSKLNDFEDDLATAMLLGEID